jgi:hypothetical protein
MASSIINFVRSFKSCIVYAWKMDIRVQSWIENLQVDDGIPLRYKIIKKTKTSNWRQITHMTATAIFEWWKNCLSYLKNININILQGKMIFLMYHFFLPSISTTNASLCIDRTSFHKKEVRPIVGFQRYD